MKNSILLLIVGALAIVLGLVALAYPFAASLTATLFVAWSFVFMGLLQIFAAFQAETTGTKVVGFLLGLVAVVIGVHIIAEPLRGLLSLTLVAGVLFLVSGVFKLRLRPFQLSRQRAFGLGNFRRGLSDIGCHGAQQLPAIGLRIAGRSLGHRASVKRHQFHRALVRPAQHRRRR